MSLATLVVTAVRLEGRTKAEVARTYGVSPRWVYELCRRFDACGEAGLEPRSRRPRSSPHRTSDELEDEILELRKELTDLGGRRRLDDPDAPAATASGPATALDRHDLADLGSTGVRHPTAAEATAKLVDPVRGRHAERAVTGRHHSLALANGTEVEILNVLDDHSRLLVGSDARGVFKAADVLASFHAAAAAHGLPASLLTDNGAVFTAAPRGGRCLLELECDRLEIRHVNSRPYHPQTCGKVERFHQTLKKFLAKQDPAGSLAELQGQLDRFRAYYNTVRPHRAIGRRTPAEAFAARPKASPRGVRREVAPHVRVRRDKVDIVGRITLRHDSRLHHIGLGRRFTGLRVIALVDGLRVRVITEDGELIRELILDPSRDYQPHSGT